MTKRTRTTPFLLVLPVAVGVLAVVSVVLGWLYLVVPWCEGRASAALGRRVRIGAVVPRWGGLEARDVTVAGLAPFDVAPLARIGRVEIALGGWPFSPRPELVTAHDALVTYLGVGLGRDAVDNVRGARPPSGRSARTPGAIGPRVRIASGRLEAFVRLPGDVSVSARSDRLELERASDGRVAGRASGLILDLPGWATVKAPALEITAAAGKLRAVGRELAVVVPGGGPLATVSSLALTHDADGTVVDVVPAAPDARAPAAQISGRLRIGAAVIGQLELAKVPLAALAPVGRRAGFGIGRGTADLRVELRAGRYLGDEPTQRLLVALTIADLDVHHPRLDRVPWQGLRARAAGMLEFARADHRLVIDGLELEALGLGARLGGWIAFDAHTRGEIELAPPAKGPGACAAALAAWPRPLRERLRGLEVEGQIGARARLVFDARTFDDLVLELELAPLCRVRSEPAVITAMAAAGRAGHPPPPSALPGLAPGGIERFAPIATLPRHVVGAFITAEDAAFRRHHGFDLENVRRALAHDLAMGAASKGASSISQQLAKNAFLSRERTIARKLAELVLTWRLEEVLGKERILELYLNIVELGPSIRGIGAASEVYFGKPAAQLTPLEAAHLAAMLPNPIGFARRFRDGRVDAGWLLKLHDLLARMRRAGHLSEAALVAARGAHLGLRARTGP